MTGTRVILFDGTTIENGRAGYAEGNLWLFLPGFSLPDAAGIFFDTDKTARIVFQYGEMEDVYTGFTRCVNLSVDTDGVVSVCLKKGGPNA